MNDKETILRIAIPSPLYTTFDYLPPADTTLENWSLGCRVKVPFGKRDAIGILVETDTKTDFERSKLKRVYELIDNTPLFTPKIMQLCKWACDYYHHPLGEIMFSALPKLLRDGKPAVIKKTTAAAQPTAETQTKIKLNAHQRDAVNAINANKGFTTFLLNGVTGSGKTEIYLQAIEELISQNRQALVLVPEISLTPQTVMRFEQRFNVPIAVFHSRLSDRQRLDAWLAAKTGAAPIIIGTRSAIFTPLTNLGIIILDEEHDLSFKQQSGLRYSARDLAIMRGKMEDIPVILGSATPALESIYNAERKRFNYLHLPERAGTAIHPTFHLIDLRNQPLRSGLADNLIQKIQHHLEQDGQVLIFLNRRGYAPTLICHSCGWVAECEHCDAKMTIHQKPYYLHCHHCATTHPIYRECPNCHGQQLIALGTGTERIEEELRELFPNVGIVRIDRDTTARKGSINKMLDDIQSNQYQILVGTQMLAKGHHFPNVTMAAIIDIDCGLFGGSFRASEHTAQLIMQVAGRAGRAEKPGEVYLQTHNPKHPLLLQLLEHGYFNFAQQSLNERLTANLPPFSHLTLIRAEAKKEADALDALTEIKEIGAKLSVNNVLLLGPVPAPMQRKGGKYRAQLLLKAKSRSTLHQLLSNLVIKITATKKFNKVHWSLDVDPVDLC